MADAPSAPKPSSSDSTPGAGAGGSGLGLGTVTVKVAGLVVLDLETVPTAAPQFGESDTTRSTGTGARRGPQWRRPAHKPPFSRGAFCGPTVPSGGGVNGSARATVAQDVDLPPDAPVAAPGRLCVRLDVGGVRPRTGIAHGGQLLARLHDVTERRLPRRVGRPPTRRLEVSGVHGAGAPRECDDSSGRPSGPRDSCRTRTKTQAPLTPAALYGLYIHEERRDH